MRIKQFLTTFIGGGALLATLSACDRPYDNMLQGLPAQGDVQVDVPENTTAVSGLSSSNQSALVGEPAEHYTTTYNHARTVNKIGVDVAVLLKTITDFPPTTYEEGIAVWGPGSDEGDPNEFMLTVRQGVADRENVVEWRLEGKHKSAAANEFQGLAFGNFDPESGTDGQGWFEINLDAIGQLNQTEEQGNIAFNYRKSGEELEIQVRFTDVIAEGDVLDAGYDFKRARDGSGSFLFDLPLDINKDDADAADKTARENLLIRTRWNTAGIGQVDLLATGGDLEDTSLELTQCWGALFVSSYEAIYINGAVEAEEGNSSNCPYSRRMVPEAGDLTSATEVQNPFL